MMNNQFTSKKEKYTQEILPDKKHAIDPAPSKGAKNRHFFQEYNEERDSSDYNSREKSASPSYKEDENASPQFLKSENFNKNEGQGIDTESFIDDYSQQSYRNANGSRKQPQYQSKNRQLESRQKRLSDDSDDLQRYQPEKDYQPKAAWNHKLREDSEEEYPPMKKNRFDE